MSVYRLKTTIKPQKQAANYLDINVVHLSWNKMVVANTEGLWGKLFSYYVVKNYIGFGKICFLTFKSFNLHTARSTFFFFWYCSVNFGKHTELYNQHNPDRRVPLLLLQSKLLPVVPL